MIVILQMASSQSPNRVYFTSFDRSVNDTNTDFTITFDTPIQNAYNFEVVSASFPNLFKSFAPYETILYFYHESFDNGNTAIGIPLSTTPRVGGFGGDPSPITGREAYIDKRYFADGTDLASYLTAWLASYSTNFPAPSTGLCPFFHAGDDPSQPPTFFADEASTGITFTNLSFTFDDLTTNGTLKLTFADATPVAVRVASVLDYGSLSGGVVFPSQLGYKLGYTDLVFEAFGTLVQVDETNNQFQLIVVSSGGTLQNFLQVTIPPNDYTPAALASFIQAFVLNPSNNAQASLYAGFTCTETGGVLSFAYGSPSGVTSYRVYFGDSSIQQACKTLLGFTNNLTTTNAGGTITAPNAVVTDAGAVSPDQHVAPDTINLIRSASIYVASSLSSGESLASAGRKDILFKIPLTAGIGDVQLYQSSLSGIVINRPPSSIRNLRITLLDDNFQIVEPLPQNASVSVEIHFAYNEDAKANQMDRVSTNLYA